MRYVWFALCLLLATACGTRPLADKKASESLTKLGDQTQTWQFFKAAATPSHDIQATPSHDQNSASSPAPPPDDDLMVSDAKVTWQAKQNLLQCHDHAGQFVHEYDAQLAKAPVTLWRLQLREGLLTAIGTVDTQAGSSSARIVILHFNCDVADGIQLVRQQSIEGRLLRTLLRGDTLLAVGRYRAADAPMICPPQYDSGTAVTAYSMMATECPGLLPRLAGDRILTSKVAHDQVLYGIYENVRPNVRDFTLLTSIDTSSTADAQHWAVLGKLQQLQAIQDEILIQHRSSVPETWRGVVHRFAWSTDGLGIEYLRSEKVGVQP